MSTSELPISFSDADLKRILELRDSLHAHPEGVEAHNLLISMSEDLDTAQMIHQAVLDQRPVIQKTDGRRGLAC